MLFAGSRKLKSQPDVSCSTNGLGFFFWMIVVSLLGHSPPYLSHHQDNEMMTSVHAVCAPQANETRAHLTPPDLEQLWGSKVKYKLIHQSFILMHRQRVRVDPLYDLWLNEFKGDGVEAGRGGGWSLLAYDVCFWCSKESCAKSDNSVSIEEDRIDLMEVLMFNVWTQ